MKCPVCTDATLVMSERKGIEIDYCPQCRGIWLDRGEIDKIIERSLEEAAVEQSPQQAVSQRAHQNNQSQPYPHHHHEDDYYHRKHKKKSFWMELFD